MAKAAGYTEPDPREDLNGLDVARKVVIAGRECGEHLAGRRPGRIPVPSELESCSAEDFATRFSENDAVIAARARDAAQEGCVLRFVGKVDATEDGEWIVQVSEDAPFRHALRRR